MYVSVVVMTQGSWKEEVEGMGFERHPQMEKLGTQEFAFEDEGNVVPARTTGYKEDSVVFVVKQDGTLKEFWISKLHPLLRELISKTKSLKGHKISVEFSGKGLDMRTVVKNFD